MKTRNGFVSNSSSSSFVVSHKEGVQPKIAIEVELREFITMTIQDEDGILEWVQSETEYDTIEGAISGNTFLKEEIEKMRKAISEGLKIVVVTLDSDSMYGVSGLVTRFDDRLGDLLKDGTLLSSRVH